jgi:hypothetical protein
LSVVIFPVAIPDLTKFRHSGLDHPTYGPLFELGAYAPVVGTPSGIGPLEAITGAPFIAAAQGCGAVVAKDAGDFPRARADAITLASGSNAASARVIHEFISQGTDVSFVFSEERSGVAALWAIVGHELPSLGALPGCSIADVWETWLNRVGAKLGYGRDLLSEYGRESSDTDDRELTNRLRQLYGG